jgi:hypothetical protein
MIWFDAWDSEGRWIFKAKADSLEAVLEWPRVAYAQKGLGPSIDPWRVLSQPMLPRKGVKEDGRNHNQMS